jgi:hypothetical protein
MRILNFEKTYEEKFFIPPPDSWKPTLAHAQTRRIREVKREVRALVLEHGDWAVVRLVEASIVPGRFLCPPGLPSGCLEGLQSVLLPTNIHDN